MSENGYGGVALTLDHLHFGSLRRASRRVPLDCARSSSASDWRVSWKQAPAVRTNDTRLIAAALGPYATEHLPDAAYDQAVLKCVFVGVPITGLDGVTAQGARMLAAFVLERVVAGRDVPSEVWSVIDRFSPEAEIAAIQRELESSFDDRCAAAERALNQRGAGERA